MRFVVYVQDGRVKRILGFYATLDIAERIRAKTPNSGILAVV